MHHRRAFALALLLASLAVPGSTLIGGNRPEEPARPAYPASRTRHPTTLIVESPSRLRLSWALEGGALRLEQRPGSRAVRAQGYGLRPAGAGLEVPFRIEYLAIPDGVTPRLEPASSRPVRTVPLEALASVPAPGRPAASAGDIDLRAGNRAGVQEREFPVSLGRIGYFRDQRFVEVRIRPVRPSADGMAIEVQEHPELVLSWDPAQARVAADIPQDPLAEPLYRRMFLNYEEARGYRVRRPERSGQGRESGSSGRTGAFGGGAASEPLDDSSLLATSSAAAETTASSGEFTASSASTGELALPQPRARIRISRDGLVRIDQALLSVRVPSLASADPRTLRLTYRGREIPIRVAGEGDGWLDPGDFIEFYGTRRVEPPTVVRADQGVFTPIYALNDFTDTNVYWLESGATSPARVATLAAGPTGNVAIEPHWLSTARLDPSDVFRPFGANDPWIACPRISDRSTSCAGFACCDFPDHDFSIALADYTPAAADAAVRLVLQGWTVGPHVADLSVNGQPLGSAPVQWESLHAKPAAFTFPNASLAASTRVTVALPGNGTGSADSVVLDSVEIDYRRLFRAVSGALEFRFPDRQARFAVDGFTSSALTAYDLSLAESLTGHPVARLLTGVRVETSGSGFRAVLQQASEGRTERRFLVAAPAAIAPPDEIAQVQSAAVCDPALGADLIVIGPAAFLDLAPGSPLERYVAHRAAQGLRVRVVKVEDIYDQFGSGSPQPGLFGFPDPQAIRDFLACAYETGAPPPPLFVLLLGDGTSDYKNIRGTSDFQNLVAAPVHTIEDTLFAYYSADEWLAAFRGGDFLPDALIGRISAGSAGEVANALGKIVSYESGPPPGSWRAHGLFVAGDGNNTAEDEAFVRDNLTAAGHFTSPFSNATLFYGQSPYDGFRVELFRSDLLNSINQGAAVVNYVGHGNFTIWDGDLIFKSADVATLANSGRLPLFISSTCLMGGYHLDVTDALGELLVHSTPDTGGIAVVTPSGLSNFNIDAQVNQVLFEALMGPARERTLGEVVLAARLKLAQQGSIFDLENLTILGDPSLRLTLPAPAPPANVRATAGNLRVDLSWQPSPDPVVGYHVYRSQASNPSVLAGALYARLTSEPLTATSFTDTQVVNTKPYAYALTSVDAEGFEGGFSTLNTTCGFSEADCVQATPFNPSPPSPPTGLKATDPGVGFRVDLSWNSNPEPDLKGYTVYYGTQPGVYTASSSAGLNTRTSVTGLENGLQYYFVVTATNTSDGFTPPGSTEPLDNESAASAEVSAVPSLIQGIRPPAMIRDLRIAPTADASSALLSWSRPTTDIYGGPASVAFFQVHRGMSVDFKPNVDTLAARLGADQTSWVDAGALTDPRPFFYFVLAEDGSGFLSSASRALPTGSNDLAIVLARDGATGLPNGNLTLSWGPVTHDIEGEPTVVDHYVVYGSPLPFGRASLSSAEVLAGDLRALSLTLPLPPGRYHYFLVAVDRRGNVSPF